MTRGTPGTPHPYRCWVEGAFTGLGYAAGLASLSVFLVASFRVQDLSMPYWGDIRWLRTDTFGFGCFIVASCSICGSEYLRLSRIARHRNEGDAAPATPFHNFVLAAARTLVLAGTILVAYLSINSITHPQTLLLQATHLLSWPTEGTLRVAGLIVIAFAVGIARSLRISAGNGPNA
jgi:hypothetical protein